MQSEFQHYVRDEGTAGVYWQVLQDNSSTIVNQPDKGFQGLYLYHALLIVLFTAGSVWAQTPGISPDTTGQQTLPSQTAPQPGQLPPSAQPGVLAPGKTNQGEDKYIFGVLPNYRTAELNAAGHPLTAKQKMAIAAKDSFAYPLVGLAVAYAFLYQLDDSHPEFGQGVEGYMKRLGTSYCDQVTGNFMTEGIYPSILKQDPRYFRMAHGSVGKRSWYAVSRIFVTKTDSGKSAPNYSELLGNATASAIGLSYYPDDRNVPDYLQNWGTQLGTDAASQILKEFWPDVKTWWHKKRHADEPMSEVPPSERR